MKRKNNLKYIFIIKKKNWMKETLKINIMYKLVMNLFSENRIILSKNCINSYKIIIIK